MLKIPDSAAELGVYKNVWLQLRILFLVPPEI